MKGYYKGFNLLNEEINFLKRKLSGKVNLYDLNVDIHDQLGFPPGVNLNPYLTSPEMQETTRIPPDENNTGKYIFKNLPSATYELYISYGSYSNIKEIKIENNKKYVDLDFKALFNLDIDILDSRGNNVEDEIYKVNIYRNKIEVYKSISSNEKISLPPGEYQIYTLLDGEAVGFKNILLTNDKEVKVVTSIIPLLPILINVLTIIFIIEILAVCLLKKISFNSLLKLIAMSLILLSIFQPWWYLHAENNQLNAMITTELYIEPQVMIDKISYNDNEFFDLATIPEMFTDFVGILLFIIISGLILLGISFLPNILLKRRFAMILIVASVIFLILVAAAFYLGMSKLAELSLGSMKGQDLLNVDLPTRANVPMNATWGLGPGFYLCIIAALIALSGGLIDLFKKKSWFNKFFKKT